MEIVFIILLCAISLVSTISLINVQKHLERVKKENADLYDENIKLDIKLNNETEKLEAFTITYSELDKKYTKLEKEYKTLQKQYDELKPVPCEVKEEEVKEEVKEEPKKATKKTTTRKTTTKKATTKKK